MNGGTICFVCKRYSNGSLVYSQLSVINTAEWESYACSDFSTLRPEFLRQWKWMASTVCLLHLQVSFLFCGWMIAIHVSNCNNCFHKGVFCSFCIHDVHSPRLITMLNSNVRLFVLFFLVWLQWPPKSDKGSLTENRHTEKERTKWKCYISV